jgi:hypothetical protein
MDMDMRKFESTPSLGIPMSLESLPTDILLELGRYLEVGDIISLRLVRSSSKPTFFNRKLMRSFEDVEMLEGIFINAIAVAHLCDECG